MAEQLKEPKGPESTVLYWYTAGGPETCIKKLWLQCVKGVKTGNGRTGYTVPAGEGEIKSIKGVQRAVTRPATQQYVRDTRKPCY